MDLIKLMMRYSPGKVVFATLLAVLSGISSTGLLLIITARFSDSEIPLIYLPESEAPLFSLPSGEGSLTYLAGAFVVLIIVMLCSNLLSQILLLHVSENAVFDLRVKLTRQILRTPLQSLEKAGNSRLLAVLTEDIPTVTETIIELPSLVTDFATLVTILASMAWLSGVGVTAALIMIVVSVVTFKLIDRWAERYLVLLRDEWDDLLAYFQALIEGNKELKLHRRRSNSFFDQHLENSITDMRGLSITQGKLYAFAGSLNDIINYIFIGILLFVLPLIADFSSVVLVAYTLLALEVSGTIDSLLGLIPSVHRAQISLRKVQELGLSLVDYEEREDKSYTSQNKVYKWQSWELVNVVHSYYRVDEENYFKMGPLNLKINAGELVYLVGGNGSGKTTLAKLLTGLYAPESGEIRLDGRAINDENRHQYSQLFTVVFSDSYLFENLLGFDQPDLDKQAMKYLKKLKIDHKVHVKDGKLSTLNLSQGQRKRLALLTAYLEDRPFYVFDEWAASQDPIFKDIFYLELLPELKARGKTVLVITHDDRYFSLADRIIKLDYGKISSDTVVVKEDKGKEREFFEILSGGRL